jgi:hypothetical protein
MNKVIRHSDYTLCLTNLEHGSEMIISESILTTFIVNIIFKDHYGSGKNWHKLKIEPQKSKFNSLKLVKHTV